MKPETVVQIIRWQGGENWLKNMEPATLFAFLEKEYRGVAKVVKPTSNNNVEGWMFFIGEIEPKVKRVIGYFYQKGKWPVCLKGKLKFDFDSWYFVTVTNHGLSPKIGDFIEKILLEVNIDL